MSAPTVGIHRDVPYETYATAWPGVRHSHLKEYRWSAAHARVAMLEPDESTNAQKFGIGGHTAILEPARFAREYARAEKWDLRTNKGKDARDQWKADHPGMTPLLEEEWEAIERIYASLASHRTAAELLSAPGLIEASAFWLDEGTREACKCRSDKIASLAGFTFVVNLKTARNATPGAFSYAVDEYCYHSAAAFAVDGLATISPRDRRHVFVVVEKEPPYACAVYELDDEAMQIGRDDYRGWLAAHKHARETGIWSAYPDGIQPLRLPDRAIKRAAFREVAA